jgi:alpha-beta hydrolase superfamily lysophospholipase
MNAMIEKQVKSSDGHVIQVYVWPNKEAKAWVHINHGMAEHALRYARFAEVLVAAGFAVLAHNHRGHGPSQADTLGCLAKDSNWQHILGDIAQVRASECHDGRPYFLFGHSMGSFIVQSFLTLYPQAIDGLILCASNLQAPTLSRLGRFVASIEKWRVGDAKPSKLIQFLSFGSFNQHFKPSRTEFDWLSRDTLEVDKYIADPLCGFACSSGFWHAFLDSLVALYRPASLQKIQADLPILCIGGSDDPVGLMGKGLPKLAQAYQQLGQANVSLKLYAQARHELLNERNRDEVMADIVNWLRQHCSLSSAC